MARSSGSCQGLGRAGGGPGGSQPQRPGPQGVVTLSSPELPLQTPGGGRAGFSAPKWQVLALPDWRWVGWGYDMRQRYFVYQHWLKTLDSVFPLFPYSSHGSFDVPASST